MNIKTKTPAFRQGNSYTSGSRLNKYTTLNNNDKRVLDLLSKGKYNVIQIGKLLNIPDPRSNIRYLRKAGFNIADYWEKTKYSRCKVYFIKEIGGIL